MTRAKPKAVPAMAESMDAAQFILESNRIEGIRRDPTNEEIAEHMRFMALETATVDDLTAFVSVYQPNARIRDRADLNVRVGDHIAPRGGMGIVHQLEFIIASAHIGGGMTPHEAHCAYETLHPFTDGNGRSGRMLWLWQMRRAPLGFLHTFYYQTLAALQDRAP